MSDFPVYHHADSMERHMIKYCNQHGINVELPSKRNRAEPAVNDYSQRIEFSENLKKLSHKKLAEIVDVIQKSCPSAITTISDGRLQLKVNALDTESFNNVLR